MSLLHSSADRVAAPREARAPTRRRFPRWLALLVVFVVVGTLSAGVGVYFGSRRPPMSLQRLMGLSTVPNRAAPNFTLTDVHGRTVSLSSFRGKAVALYFMDPKCHDVCPLVATELEEADHHLGAAARHVALVGVDVNPNALSRRDLRVFEREHGLDRLANFHYLTGSLPALRRVWERYSITVQVAPQNGNVYHSTVMDFIGPNGHERAMAVPGALLRRNGTGYLPGDELTRWGTGIARELRRIL